MSSLSVGILGFGRIGAEHAGWLATARGIHAAAIADATPARRDLAKARGLRVYESAGEILAEASVSSVLIALPTSMHFEHALAALRAGKHVMIEKPMTLDLRQACDLLAEAKRVGRTLSVFQNRRWDADYLTVRDALASGKLGRVFNVESRLGQWSSCVGPAAREWRPEWRNEAAYGGGGLYDWGSHFIDQLWRLMLPAKPLRVFAQLRANVWSRDCDDFARVCIDFDSGATGLVEINTTTTRPLPRWHLDGTAGSAESPYSPSFDVSRWAGLDLLPAGENALPQRLPLARAGLSEVQIWEQFAAAVRGEGAPAVSAQSVLPTMALLDAARESGLKGCAVELPAEIQWEE